MTTEPPGPRPADVLLADGSVAVIRPLASEDAAQLRRLHRELSARTLWLRFFSVGRATAEAYVEHLLRERPLTLLAEQDGRLLGLATAETVDPETAEVSFVVEDGRHGLGLGSLLLEHLAAAARQRGVTTLVAEVLLENRAMLDVLADAGFAQTREVDRDTVVVRLDNDLSEQGLAVADARERRAEARSLHPLLHPRSVAVVGVRSDGQGVGRAVLDNIRAGGFSGDLVVVHPKADSVAGVPVVATFADLPRPVDLAIVAVPAARVPDAVAAAAEAGVPVAVVISSGFEELGEGGSGLQHALARLARDRSIRVVGPNCLGVVCNAPEIGLNATFSRSVPPDGGLAVATQSGGVGIVLAELAQELGLGIGTLVSLGNKVDVSGNDLVAAWTEDPRVAAGALYLESFGNAPKFARIARTFSERKPLLAVVGGRSDGGRRAGASHTAAAATPRVGVAALFAQAGVIECDGPDDLAEAALLLTCEPLPRGPLLGVVSNAGGMGVLAADAAEREGLVVPELSERTRGRVAAHVLGTVGTSNPVDAGAAVAPDALAGIVEAVLQSEEVDALLVELVATSLADPGVALAALAAARDRHPGTPLLLVTRAVGGEEPDVGGLTRFRSSAAAVRALGRAVRYAAWRADRTADLGVELQPPPPLGLRLARRAVASEVLARGAGPDGWVGVADARRVLDDYGLAPVGVLVHGPAAAAAAATSLGFPVVVKVADGEVVHRTERGLVRAGLGEASAVTRAVTSFERELGRSGVPVLVQPLARGLELAVGLVRDPSFGPLVMVGAGGITTDVLADRAYLLPPVHPRDVRRALRGLRCWPLLQAFRGADPLDVDALVSLVVACGRLAVEVPEVAELDVNPVMVTSAGVTLVDVKLRLAANPSDGSGEPRQLRHTP